MSTTVDRLRGHLSHVYGLRGDTLLTVFLTALARSLDRTNADGDSAVAQLNLRRASDEYLDMWGDYFAVARLPGEGDAAYSRRIIEETLMLRCNNLALERILLRAFGYTAHVKDLWPYVLLSDQWETPAGHPRHVGDGHLTTPDFGGPTDTATRLGVAAPYLPGCFGVWIDVAVEQVGIYTLEQVKALLPLVLISDDLTTTSLHVLDGQLTTPDFGGPTDTARHSFAIPQAAFPLSVDDLMAVVHRHRAAGTKPILMQLSAA